MSDPFVAGGGEPTERTFEWLHQWGQLVPLLKSDPRQATSLLEDRDRAAAQWINAHAHEAGAPAAGGLNVYEARLTGAQAASTGGHTIAWDIHGDLTGTTHVTYETGNEFGLGVATVPPARGSWLVMVNASLEDSVTDGNRHLLLEWSDDFWTSTQRTPLATAPSTSNPDTGLSGNWLATLGNSALMRVRIEHDNGGSTAQDVLVTASVTIIELVTFGIDA